MIFESLFEPRPETQLSAFRTAREATRGAHDADGAGSASASDHGARNGPVSSVRDSDGLEPRPSDILRASSTAHGNKAGRQY